MIVYKYPLTNGSNVLELPLGAKLLTVGVQQNVMTVWALVDPDAPKVLRGIAVTGTGWVLSNMEDVKYVGTIFTDAGYVWHVFDLGERPLNQIAEMPKVTSR